MKALVTGGAGFIGSHLAQQLATDGNEVIVVDNLSTGSLKNITALVGKPGFEFVKGDIRDGEAMKARNSEAHRNFHKEHRCIA